MAVATPLSLNNIAAEFGSPSGKALTQYYRGNGRVPSHSANLSIPATTTNLKISQFSGAELNFSATVTVGDNGGGLSLGQYGYKYANFGSITRDIVGLTRTATSAVTLLDLYEFGSFNGFFVTYYVIIRFNADVRYSALGYHFFDSLTVNGNTFNRVDAATDPDGVLSSGATVWDWVSGAGSRLLPTSGTYSFSLAFSGP